MIHWCLCSYVSQRMLFDSETEINLTIDSVVQGDEFSCLPHLRWKYLGVMSLSIQSSRTVHNREQQGLRSARWILNCLVKSWLYDCQSARLQYLIHCRVCCQDNLYTCAGSQEGEASWPSTIFFRIAWKDCLLSIALIVRKYLTVSLSVYLSARLTFFITCLFYKVAKTPFSDFFTPDSIFTAAGKLHVEWRLSLIMQPVKNPMCYWVRLYQPGALISLYETTAYVNW